MKNLFKKLLVICGILAAVSSTTNLFAPQSASATTFSCRNFLGMVSWDCNLPDDINSEEKLKNNIWTIAVNVANDIAVLAAYLVIGYVIYGGYLYIFSGGDPNKVTTGKRALSHAFIGLAIVMTANIIVTAIRVALVGSSGNIGACTTDAGCVAPDQMVINLIQWVMGVAGVVALIFIVYGAISYTTSSGDPNKVQKAKNIILYAAIGLVIVAAAEIITAFVSSTIRDAAYINQTTISKEVYETKIN